MTPPIQFFLLVMLYWLGICNCCSALSIIQHPKDYPRNKFHPRCPDVLVLLPHRQQSRIGLHRLRRDPAAKTSASIAHHVRQTLTLSSSSGYDTNLWDSNNNSRSIIHHHPRMDSIVDDGQKQTRHIRCGGGSSSSNCDMKQKSTFNCSELHHSIAILAYCRRLSFLFLSIMVVNFVRSTILKASVGTH